MLTIGKMGQCAGVKMPTIRSCEEIGLLPGAQRSGTIGFWIALGLLFIGCGGCG